MINNLKQFYILSWKQCSGVKYKQCNPSLLHCLACSLWHSKGSYEIFFYFTVNLALSRICWDWRNSFDLEKIRLDLCLSLQHRVDVVASASWFSTYEGLKTIEYKEKRTWIDLRLRRLFDLGKVDCIFK